MALKKSYSRYFIILQEDEKGYSLASDKVSSGYVKLEMKNDKCKISYYVQNLKKEATPYYMILICNRKDVKKIIKVGEMNIDDYGRADVCYEYPVENVAGSNISMDKISGAAIVKILNNNIISVMSGFASTEIPEWKSFVLIEDQNRNESKDEDQNKDKGNDRETSEEKSIFDKYEEIIESVKIEERTEGGNNEEVKEPIAKEENLDAVNESHETLEQEKTEDIRQEGSVEAFVHENPIESEEADNQSLDSGETQQLDESEDIGDYPRGSTGDFFKALVHGFEELPDLCSSIKRCKWYKVPVKCVEDMYDVSDYNRYTIVYYPMISYYPYIKNFGHYLVGYKCDKKGKVKYLVYGIPGIKDKMYQPFGGSSGFVTWIPAKEGHKVMDGFGYWLMFYDFKTSTIVIPVKK